MNTIRPMLILVPKYRSDSSMVDEYDEYGNLVPRESAFRFLYGRWIQEVSRGAERVLTSSDSSMVDEYDMDNVNLSVNDLVQIPLWSMNTEGPWLDPDVILKFRFLYGRWIRGWSGSKRCISWVQIPLWSMNTSRVRLTAPLIGLFRFLYGRWIPEAALLFHRTVLRSDSSMVDEYAGGINDSCSL